MSQLLCILFSFTCSFLCVARFRCSFRVFFGVWKILKICSGSEHATLPVYMPVPPFYVDTGPTGSGPLYSSMTSSQLGTPARTLRLNKVIFRGAGGWDFSMVLGRHNSTHSKSHLYICSGASNSVL